MYAKSLKMNFDKIQWSWNINNCKIFKWSCKFCKI